MAKRKLTSNQQAYEKERKRIQQFVRRAKKRGYFFPDDIVPSRPKTVRKRDIERVKRLKSETLYKRAVYIADEETGLILSGEERRKQERQEASRKARQTLQRRRIEAEQERKQEEFYRKAESDVYFTHQIIEMFRYKIRVFPKVAEPILSSWLDMMIEKMGADPVAYMLQESAANGLILDYTIAYSEERIQGYIAQMLDFLPDITDEWKAEIMEGFEQFEEWAIV